MHEFLILLNECILVQLISMHHDRAENVFLSSRFKLVPMNLSMLVAMRTTVQLSYPCVLCKWVPADRGTVVIVSVWCSLCAAHHTLAIEESDSFALYMVTLF